MLIAKTCFNELNYCGKRAAFVIHPSNDLFNTEDKRVYRS